MSIICDAASRFGSPGLPVDGSGMSPKCTAAVVASDRTKALKVMLLDDSCWEVSWSDMKEGV